MNRKNKKGNSRDDINGDLKKKMDKIKEWMKEREEGRKMIIGRDFDARTGKGREKWREENNNERGERKLMSKIANRKGKKINKNNKGEKLGNFK